MKTKYLVKISIITNGKSVKTHEGKHPIIKEGKKTVTIQPVDREGINDGNPKMIKREKLMKPSTGVLKDDSYRFSYSSIKCFEEQAEEAKQILIERVRADVARKLEHVQETASRFEEWAKSIDL